MDPKKIGVGHDSDSKEYEKPITPFGMRMIKRHRGGSWWAARQLERKAKAIDLARTIETTRAARGWYSRYVRELEALGCIVGETQPNGDTDIKVPPEKMDEYKAITAKYSVNGVFKKDELPGLIFAAWRSRFADVANLHLLAGKATDDKGKEIESLIIGVELTTEIMEMAVIEIMKECAIAFGFPPGVKSCSLVTREQLGTTEPVSVGHE